MHESWNRCFRMARRCLIRIAINAGADQSVPASWSVTCSPLALLLTFLVLAAVPHTATSTTSQHCLMHAFMAVDSRKQPPCVTRESSRARARAHTHHACHHHCIRVGGRASGTHLMHAHVPTVQWRRACLIHATTHVRARSTYVCRSAYFERISQ